MLKATFLFLFLSLAILFQAASASAQKNAPPSSQFGVGILTGGSGGASGLEGVFALNQHMQVGTLFGLQLQSGGGESSTTLEFAPFFRYQFVSTVSPFLQGGLAIVSVGGTSSSGMFLGGGLAYYIAETFGIHADVDILSVGFSPSLITFGWANGRVGVDWFL